MRLNDGTDWTPDGAQIEKWKSLYPAVDVLQELRAMEGWLDANPRRRKTRSGVARFCNTWLSKAQDRGGSSPPLANARGVSPSGSVRTRDMTTLDELTHNFTDDPAMDKYFMEKHGQVFTANGERKIEENRGEMDDQKRGEHRIPEQLALDASGGGEDNGARGVLGDEDD